MEISSIPANHWCWICGKQVASENCKVDEYGFPVHGECDVVRVAFNSMRPQPNAVDAVEVRNTLRA
jgi:hypothetical protein